MWHDLLLPEGSFVQFVMGATHVIARTFLTEVRTEKASPSESRF